MITFSSLFSAAVSIAYRGSNKTMGKQ